MFSHPGLNMTMKSKQGNFSNHLASFPRIPELKEPVQETLAWSNHSYALLQPMVKMSYRFNHNQNFLLGKVFSQDLFFGNFSSYGATMPGPLESDSSP